MAPTGESRKVRGCGPTRRRCGLGSRPYRYFHRQLRNNWVINYAVWRLSSGVPMSRDEHDRVGLPENLEDLFWEYDVSELDWGDHREFIARRVLSHGTWAQICWLRDKLGDREVRRIIEARRGRDLSPRQLRFWQLILDIPAKKVDRWLDEPGRQIWDNRVR